MKVISAVLLAFWILVLGLHAQPTAEITDKEIPEEESEPPFKVGDLAIRAGYYLDLGEGMKLNFRMVGTKMRLYWIDGDGLVVEPPSKAGNVRFRKSVNGKKLYDLKPVDGGSGLGHPQYIPYPHTFNLVLNVKDPESGELKTYPFRYNQPMSTPQPREE
ncbi:MAG: hypothetical protein ACPGKS_03730 [Coraliomargarita sp.]